MMKVKQLNNIISDLKDGIDNIPIDVLVAFYKKCPSKTIIERSGSCGAMSSVGPDVGGSLKEALEQWIPKEKKDEQGS